MFVFRVYFTYGLIFIGNISYIMSILHTKLHPNVMFIYKWIYICIYYSVCNLCYVCYACLFCVMFVMLAFFFFFFVFFFFCFFFFFFFLVIWLLCSLRVNIVCLLLSLYIINLSAHLLSKNEKQSCV